MRIKLQKFVLTDNWKLLNLIITGHKVLYLEILTSFLYNIIEFFISTAIVNHPEFNDYQGMMFAVI